LAYSGGQLTDWAGHHIDIAHWGLGYDRTGPISVQGEGVYPREGIFDVPVEYDQQMSLRRLKPLPSAKEFRMTRPDLIRSLWS